MTDNASTDSATDEPRPRVRWAAIVWGLVVTAIAITALYIRADAARSADFATWLGGLTPTSIALIAVLVVGVFVLVAALLSVVKRAQLKAGGQPVG